MRKIWNKIVEFLKKIWRFIVSIPQDKLLHDYATYLIAAFTFAVCFIFIPFWWSFLTANVVAVLCGFGKEIYDLMHPDGHSCDFVDLLYDLSGLVKFDIFALLLAIAIL